MRLAPLLLAPIVLLSGCTNTPQEYPGSEEIAGASLMMEMAGVPEGASVKAYRAEASVKEILDWYAGLGGYSAVEGPQVSSISLPQGTGELGWVVLQKGSEGMGVWAVGGSLVGATTYYVARGPVEELLGEKEGLPGSDAVSADEPVERYPGSVLLEYEKGEGYPLAGSSLRLTYGTDDRVSEVVEWYRKMGWKVESESVSGEEAELALSKGPARMYVEVYGPGEERSYTLIDVSYMPNRLPDRDLAEGEEPVERYPGSIMSEYSRVEYPGAVITSITYVSADEPDRILDWFSEKLKGSGWQVVSQSGTESSLLASKGAEFVQVTVDDSGSYSEVSLAHTTSG